MAIDINKLIDKIASNKFIIPVILFVLCCLITFQNFQLGTKQIWNGEYTHYNNYIIFKNSFFHLIENKNLYDFYPKEYGDLYKYSPTFALFMVVFAIIPNYIGLLIWNLINVFVLFFAIKSITNINEKQKLFFLLFIIFELILSTQNSQSNALLAGLGIITYNQFEKGNNILATLLIALGFYIKIYSLLGCLLILIYPNRLKSIISMAAWSILLLIIPLVVVSPSELINQYINWYELLKMDQNQSIGMSAYLYVNAIIPADSYKLITIISGFLILFSPLIFIKKYSNNQFRAYYLALILIWMVIYNHKAESPTFIIVMAGVGIWYFNSVKSKINLWLTIACLFFTSIWFTDIIPKAFKASLVDPNYIKPLFPIIILLVIFYELITLKTNSYSEINS